MLVELMTNKTEIWFKGMVSGTVISIFGCVAADFYSESRKYIRRLKDLDVFPLSDYHMAKGALRKLKIINLSPMLFCRLLKLKNK